MDLSLVTGAVTALRTALDIGKTAVEVRDATKLNDVIIRMNEQLLNAQQSLFSHNAELLALQQQHFEATQKLRELQEALTQRGRYTLVELAPGKFAYKADSLPMESGADNEVRAEPMHHICQPCFDGAGKVRSVLQRSSSTYNGRTMTTWLCPTCKHILS